MPVTARGPCHSRECDSQLQTIEQLTGSEAVTIGVDARTVTNSYDTLNRMRTTTSSGVTMTVDYDALDRRTSQSLSGAGASVTTNYQYDATGQ